MGCSQIRNKTRDLLEKTKHCSDPRVYNILIRYSYQSFHKAMMCFWWQLSMFYCNCETCIFWSCSSFRIFLNFMWHCHIRNLGAISHLVSFPERFQSMSHLAWTKKAESGNAWTLIAQDSLVVHSTAGTPNSPAVQ